jgi:hypothetical protein
MYNIYQQDDHVVRTHYVIHALLSVVVESHNVVLSY